MSRACPASADNRQQPTHVEGECVAECVGSDKSRKRLLLSASISHTLVAFILLIQFFYRGRHCSFDTLNSMWKCCDLSVAEWQLPILISNSYITHLVLFQITWDYIIWVSPFGMWCRNNVMYKKQQYKATDKTVESKKKIEFAIVMEGTVHLAQTQWGRFLVS